MVGDNNMPEQKISTRYTRETRLVDLLDDLFGRGNYNLKVSAVIPGMFMSACEEAIRS